MNIISIDIGIIHLGIICAIIPTNFWKNDKLIYPEDIYLCKRINIKNLIYDCNGNCKWKYHDKCITDYIMHLFEIYNFDKYDKIIIEKQPPEGITVVEELIYREYRNKTIKISPNEMLCYFGYSYYDYEYRKTLTTKRATEYLNNHKNFHELCDCKECIELYKESKFIRRHDIADSFCILYYYLVKEKEIEKEKEKEKKYKKNFSSILKKLDSYKYVDDRFTRPQKSKESTTTNSI